MPEDFIWPELIFQAPYDVLVVGVGRLQDPGSFRCQPEKLLATAASLGSWIPKSGVHVAFGLQSFQSGVNRADRNPPYGSQFDFAPDRSPISLILQPEQGEQYRLLEFP